MKTSVASSKSGVALVLVLAFLALLTLIITAFFFSVSAQVSLTDAVATSAATDQLADSAVQVVQAQIVDATKGTDIAGGNGYISWASQPGAIRTYSSSPNSGGSTPLKVYKLYSSEKMVADGGGFQAEKFDDWTTLDNRDVYTDLNAPVLTTAGDLVYPIVDPDADGTNKAAATFKVDGFSITKPPGYTDGKPSGAGNNRAPMPVKWLYQLKDGTLHAPSAHDSKTVTISEATALNPIVGRIAFWSDDETGKVNINTAAEGTYWDLPRVWSQEDFGTMAGANRVATVGFSACQPARNEYQRYPGHPATTCLSPVFGSLPGMSISFPYPTQPTSTNDTQLNWYYNITPRIGLPNQAGGGGSKGGTIIYVDPNNQGIVVDQDRLYASVDELMFSSVKSSPRVPNTDGNNPSIKTPGKITKSVLEKARFFITANSSAPETTLFNTPRISIWPVGLESKVKRTNYDKLSAFCSTVKPANAGTVADAGAYYFTRGNPRSPTADMQGRNLTLYHYLQNMTKTPIPGYGGDFRTKYPAANTTAELKDLDIASNINLSKATDCDQILTEIVDYIHSTSLQDKSQGAQSFTPLHVFNNPGATLAAGEVMPLRVEENGTQGFGRYYSFTQAVLHFYTTKQTYTKGAGKPYTPTKMRCVFYLMPATPAQGLSPLRANLRYAVKGLDQLQIRFTGQNDAVSLNLPPSGNNYIECSDIDLLHGRGIGGSEMPNLFLVGANRINKGFNPATDWGYTGALPANKYPFFSKTEVDIPLTSPINPQGVKTFSFLGTAADKPVTVEISDAGSGGAVIQTVKLNFPPVLSPASLRCPRPSQTPPANPASTAEYDTPNPFGTRQLVNPSYNIIDGPSTYSPPLQEPNSTSIGDTGLDTVVALEVAGVPDSTPNDPDPGPALDSTAGDFRMVAGMRSVPTGRFRPHYNYLNRNPEGTAYAHGLLLTIGDYLHGGMYGNLIKLGAAPTNDKTAANHWYFQTNSNTGRQPDVSYRARDGVTHVGGSFGDWDTGWGDQKDGPHINKPDEGDSKFDDTQGAGFRSPYSLGYGQGYASAGNSYFSPTRMVPSPMMFGSLPTGLLRMKPWQTLSFCPRPEDTTHPGNAAGQPKDHLLADLFWMPVVEPYAISQPFATAGKINLNYQIMPFTYISRQTGLYAVLKATKFGAIPKSSIPNYKPLDGAANNSARVPSIRLSIDLPGTIGPDGIGKKFVNNDLYRSATEICEINLLPYGQNRKSTDMAAWWAGFPATGDNLREKPYVDLYSRLTTKSNTYTVHAHVQSLKKSRNTPANQWVFGVDTVAGDYRGSTIIERYIDLNDTNMPDFASTFATSPTADTPNLDTHYKMRVVATRRFSP